MQLFSSLQNFPQGPSKYIFELQCEKVWWQKVQYLISALSGARWFGPCRVECLHFVQPGGRDQRQATWEIFLSLDISEGALKCHSKLCPCCIADTDIVSDVSGQTPGPDVSAMPVMSVSWPDVWHQSQDGPGLGGTCLSLSLNRRPPALSPLPGILFRIQLPSTNGHSTLTTYNPKWKNLILRWIKYILKELNMNLCWWVRWETWVPELWVIVRKRTWPE